MPPRFKLLPPRSANFGDARHIDYLLCDRPPSMVEDGDQFELYSEILLLMGGKNRCRIERIEGRYVRELGRTLEEARSITQSLIKREGSPFCIQRVYQEGQYEFYSWSEDAENALVEKAEKQDREYHKKSKQFRTGVS